MIVTTSYRRAVTLAGLLLMALLAVCCASPGFAVPQNVGKSFSPQLQAKLDQYMTSTLKESQAPGMTLAVWIPGPGEYMRARGLADIATKEPMRVSDTFRIGGLPGFVSMAVRNPDTDATIVFMLNAQPPTGDTLKELAELLPILYPGIKL